MDFVAVISLAFVASITPGPNNLMLWASGMNYGIRRTVPHLAGVSLGFTFLLFVVAIGLGAVFERFPAIELTLKFAGSAFLLWMAYGLFTSAPASASSEQKPPLTFLQAALFQWVNPKAWVMGITATSTGLDLDQPLIIAAASLVGLFGIVNLPCIITWAMGGALASRSLDDPRRMQIANRILGVLLAATALLIIS